MALREKKIWYGFSNTKQCIPTSVGPPVQAHQARPPTATVTPSPARRGAFPQRPAARRGAASPPKMFSPRGGLEHDLL